jgi:DNA-binding beta-propeller fold protein YncE
VLAVSDYKAGKVVATAPIGMGVDGAAFDPATGDVFTANGEGTLTVIHEDSPDKYTVVQNLTTSPGSRNMGLDPATHKIYVVTAKFGPPPAGAPPGRARGAVLPDSFGLFIIERSGR